MVSTLVLIIMAVVVVMLMMIAMMSAVLAIVILYTGKGAQYDRAGKKMAKAKAGGKPKKSKKKAA